MWGLEILDDMVVPAPCAWHTQTLMSHHPGWERPAPSPEQFTKEPLRDHPNSIGNRQRRTGCRG